MEKYSNWRDPGTGIQPFLPPAPVKIDRHIGQIVVACVRDYLFGPLIALARIVLLIPVLVLLVSTRYISYLFVFHALKRLYQDWVTGGLIRLTLFLLGFHFIPFNVVSLKKGRQDPTASGSGQRQPDSIQSGDIIVANHTSYVDIIYLYGRFNPVFVQMKPLDTTTTTTSRDPTQVEHRFRRVSVYEALRGCGGCPAAASSSGTSLAALTREARARRSGPVVVFIEGTTSNGRALLKPMDVFRVQADVDRESRIHLLLLKYTTSYPSPVFPVGNKLAHCFKMCCQAETPKLADQDLPSQPKSALPVDNLNSQLTQLLANLGRLRATKQGYQEKQKFLAYYYR
ncbi:hypothetical protein BJ085DRAFT_32571 [Dimargaris cristalligena]|uniref:Phospholipid/glycerol acyltransferase domain-containing protein n=1 Tax=Dimargaris cristalligena TaxID=215637 RepID=A0A4P9ZMX6_9FUNG|nr:hypothetical protein BJ085DRAFT_32571 [Dimargaris cristalligena]|eukprot:RKP33660.1 hypothetical protein BJ085DRAFT_32571 [Dimargaris cristalligena]